MGYKSRVYIISKNKNSDFGEVIAMYDCSCMSNGFTSLFDKPIDFRIYNDNDKIIIKDKYGEICKYTDIHEVIQWLKHEMKYQRENIGAVYRRLNPLYRLLKAFDNNAWIYKSTGVYNNDFEMLVIHYGY